jgi:hypothetical protein
VPLGSISAVGFPPRLSGTLQRLGSKCDSHPGHGTPLIILAAAPLVRRRVCVHGPSGRCETNTLVTSLATPHVAGGDGARGDRDRGA